MPKTQATGNMDPEARELIRCSSRLLHRLACLSGQALRGNKTNLQVSADIAMALASQLSETSRDRSVACIDLRTATLIALVFRNRGADLGFFDTLWLPSPYHDWSPGA